MAQSIQRCNPSGLFDASQNFHSQVTLVEPSKLAFFSGQVAWTADSMTAPGSLSEQAKLIVQNLEIRLDSVKATRDDVVIVRIYVVDLNDERSREVFPPITEFFRDVQPSITSIGVQALFSPDLQVEVEMVARVPA